VSITAAVNTDWDDRGLDQLDPALDPYRCPDCLAAGDSCRWHRVLSAAVDLTFLLTDLDHQDATQ
jgi:hypothetical protein